MTYLLLNAMCNNLLDKGECVYLHRVRCSKLHRLKDAEGREKAREFYFSILQRPFCIKVLYWVTDCNYSHMDRLYRVVEDIKYMQ